MSLTCHRQTDTDKVAELPAGSTRRECNRQPHLPTTWVFLESQSNQPLVVREHEAERRYQNPIRRSAKEKIAWGGLTKSVPRGTMQSKLDLRDGVRPRHGGSAPRAHITHSVWPVPYAPTMDRHSCPFYGQPGLRFGSLTPCVPSPWTFIYSVNQHILSEYLPHVRHCAGSRGRVGANTGGDHTWKEAVAS